MILQHKKKVGVSFILLLKVLILDNVMCESSVEEQLNTMFLMRMKCFLSENNQIKLNFCKITLF